jgi:hypothetical protein
MSSSSFVSRHHAGHPSTIRLVLAWISAALLPVAIMAGRAVSNAFLDARGYPQPISAEPPGLGLAAFGLLALIVLVPTITAIWFGFSASRAGRPSGQGAAVVAGVIGGGLVLLGLPLFLSRVIGWPLVLLIGAALAAATGTIVSRNRR